MKNYWKLKKSHKHSTRNKQTNKMGTPRENSANIEY